MDEIRGLEMDDGGGGGGTAAAGQEGETKSAATLLARSLSKVSAATYNAKKTAAQGMMDIALLTANANQLRYILEFRDDRSTNFIVLLVLIVCSLILQVNITLETTADTRCTTPTVHLPTNLPTRGVRFELRV